MSLSAYNQSFPVQTRNGVQELNVGKSVVNVAVISGSEGSVTTTTASGSLILPASLATDTGYRITWTNPLLDSNSVVLLTAQAALPGGSQSAKQTVTCTYSAEVFGVTPAYIQVFSSHINTAGSVMVHYLIL